MKKKKEQFFFERWGRWEKNFVTERKDERKDETKKDGEIVDVSN